jgi:hypothetical protein
MRGADEQTGALFSYLSPEAMVPKDHPLRAIRPLVNVALARLSPDFARLYANPQSGGAVRDSLDQPASRSRDAPEASPASRFVLRVFGTVSASSIRTIQKSNAVTNWQYNRRVKSPPAGCVHANYMRWKERGCVI